MRRLPKLGILRFFSDERGKEVAQKQNRFKQIIDFLRLTFNYCLPFCILVIISVYEPVGTNICRKQAHYQP